MTTRFQTLGLPNLLVNNVLQLGFHEPTPIQQQAIPAVLSGRDVLAAAQTGTGKTAAFALPLITHLITADVKRAPKTASALILSPTRELAAQIEESIRHYAAGTGLTTALVFGGVNIQPQTKRLADGIDILVATPGRLLDHIHQGNIRLSETQFLVLDEADRMLDMGFIRDIRKILEQIPDNRQTLLFSATFNDEIRALAARFLKNPIYIEIEKNKECALIQQEVFFVSKKQKHTLLRDLIVDNNWQQVLVFTRMKHAANRLTEQLTLDGLSAAAIHGNKSQTARTKALAGFKDKTIRILVATDIAARGLDIEGLPQVVNYEMPNAAEDYVHRIGRTGRAGLTGLAVSFVSKEELDALKAVERLLKKTFVMKTIDGHEIPSATAHEKSKSRNRKEPKTKRLPPKSSKNSSDSQNNFSKPPTKKHEAKKRVGREDSSERRPKKTINPRYPKTGTKTKPSASSSKNGIKAQTALPSKRTRLSSSSERRIGRARRKH